MFDGRDGDVVWIKEDVRYSVLEDVVGVMEPAGESDDNEKRMGVGGSRVVIRRRRIFSPNLPICCCKCCRTVSGRRGPPAASVSLLFDKSLLFVVAVDVVIVAAGRMGQSINKAGSMSIVLKSLVDVLESGASSCMTQAVEAILAAMSTNN